MCNAATSSAARACVPRPVVPTTSPTPSVAAAVATDSVTLALVKSIQTSALPRAGKVPVISTPARSLPASTPASLPTETWPGRSDAAERIARGVAASTARVSARPIRPSAPRTAMRTCRAIPLLRQQPELVELRAQLGAELFGQRVERRPDLLGHAPHHRQRGLDRDRVRLDEQAFAQRQQAVVNLPRLVPVTRRRRVPHPAHQRGRDVADDRDDAASAQREQRKRGGVVTR